ncbi:MAG: T9SS type A sorting domain-containing protein [Bacteroidetes bacterium]|nr:T9SS type A sorting domain-containing protein [Bacteroidota bacterium]
MKKLSFLVIAFFTYLTLNAQIKITLNGNTGIGTTTPNEKLEINGNIRGNFAGGALKVNTASNGYITMGPQNEGYCHIYTDRPNFIFNKIPLSISGEFGSYNTSDFIIKTGVSYLNPAGNSRITIKNSNGYVGIGTSTPQYLLDINGTMRVQTTVYSSDERLKENIKNLNSSLNFLNKLNGVSYNFKSSPSKSQKPPISASDTSSHAGTGSGTTEETIDTRKHMGFIAQDVQKIFPELVYEDKDGMLGIDYISLIPVLAESIKELDKNKNDEINRLQNELNDTKSKLAELESRLNQCCNSTTKKSGSVIEESDLSLTIDEEPEQISTMASLNQNSPNPFNQNTSISFYLPPSITEAKLYIYNMEGIQLKSIAIEERNKGSIVLNGSAFMPGMYLYTLMADGKEIDTKRMILTE